MSSFGEKIPPAEEKVLDPCVAVGGSTEGHSFLLENKKRRVVTRLLLFALEQCWPVGWTLANDLTNTGLKLVLFYASIIAKPLNNALPSLNPLGCLLINVQRKKLVLHHR
jgi:hypothetical protein